MRENVLFLTPNTFWAGATRGWGTEGPLVRPRSAGPISWVLFAIQQSNLRLFYEALCAPLCPTQTTIKRQLWLSHCTLCAWPTRRPSHYGNFEPFAFWLDSSGLWAAFPKPATIFLLPSFSENGKPSSQLQYKWRVWSGKWIRIPPQSIPNKATPSQINCKKVSGNTLWICINRKKKCVKRIKLYYKLV